MAKHLPVFVLIFGLGLFGVASGGAITNTYTFTGDCAQGDCTGQGTGTLTLANYTLGNQLVNPSFVTFIYSSNLISFSLDSAHLSSISGSVAILPGFNTVTISGTDAGGFSDFFTSAADGTWFVARNLQGFDTGTNGTWSGLAAGVPEPSSVALFGIGMTGILLFARRRKSATPVSIA